MLKFENTAEVGQFIKAYDFEPMEGRTDRFLIGKVIDKGMNEHCYYAYTVEVVESPEYPERVGETVFVPFETDFTEFDGRVTLWDANA